jgi:hypothetical protein
VQPVEPTVYESTVKISVEEEVARVVSNIFNNIVEVQQGMSAVSKDFDMAVVSCQPTEVDKPDLAQNEPFVFPSVNKGLGEGYQDSYIDRIRAAC